MSSYLKYNEEKGFYESNFDSGTKTDEVVDAYWRFYTNEPPTRMPGAELRELVDLSDMRFLEIPTEDIQQIVRIYRRLKDELNLARVRLSVFAPSDLAFGMARVFLARAEEGDFEVGLFRNREEAERYLATA